MKKVITLIVIVALIVFGMGFAYFWNIENNAQKQTEQNLIRAKEIYDAIPIWHKKINTEEDLKIGIITDTHVHPKRINKDDERSEAVRYLSESQVAPIINFVEQMKQFKPDFIVHLGDVIEGTDDPDNVGIMGIKLVKAELEKTNVPIYWAIGNHDLRSVTKEQFKEVLMLDSLTQSFDVGDYRFIILDANYNAKNVSRAPKEGKYIRGHLPPEQIDWLKKQLATDKQTFIFLHHGVFLDNSAGDYDKEKQSNKMKQSINNAKELQNIMEEYRVAGLFNGHMEARRHEQSRWTSFNSLTGTKKSKDYPDSYYELTITDGVPDVTMYYIPPGTTQIKKVDFESGEK